MADEGDSPPQKQPEGPSEKAEAAAAAPPAPGSEDQITNAVAFLTHPKVRESTEASKRSFLKSKGLSEADIDEAFRRAGPASASAPATSASPASTSAAGAGGAQQQPPKPWERQPAGAAPKQESLRWTQVSAPTQAPARRSEGENGPHAGRRTKNPIVCSSPFSATDLFPFLPHVRPCCCSPRSLHSFRSFFSRWCSAPASRREGCMPRSRRCSDLRQTSSSPL